MNIKALLLTATAASGFIALPAEAGWQSRCQNLTRQAPASTRCYDNNTGGMSTAGRYFGAIDGEIERQNNIAQAQARTARLEATPLPFTATPTGFQNYLNDHYVKFLFPLY